MGREICRARPWWTVHDSRLPLQPLSLDPSLVNSPRCVRTHAHTRARGCDVASSPTAAILWRLERPSSFCHDRSSHRHSTCIVYSCLFNLYTARFSVHRFSVFTTRERDQFFHGDRGEKNRSLIATCQF